MNISTQKLLEQLADGQYHSGESLGELLGISRAAIWKQLQALQTLGVNVQSVKGRGYCVEGGLDLLHRAEIEKGFNELIGDADSKLTKLIVENELDSTSQYLIKMSAQGEAIHGWVCFAEKQSAGRGRRGRVWQSPFASNLYFSIGWRIHSGVAAVEGLSLAVGVCLCEALEHFGFVDLQLKWPNDLLYKNKKLGGILLEISGDAAGECDLVLGVGLNVSMSEKAAEEIDQPWIDLFSIANEQARVLPSRDQLAAHLLHALFSMLRNFEAQGFAQWRDPWQKRNAHAGKEITLHMGAKAQAKRGMMLGVNNSGALLLNTEQGVEAFIGGEISLRSLD